jgi:hypothetical protein
MAVFGAGGTLDFTTLVDKPVALRYLGSDATFNSEWGVRTAARAQVIDLERKRNKGQTLIFQAAIAQEVRNHGDDWVVGTLRHEKHPNPKKAKDGFTMYVLDTEGIDLDEVSQILADLGIDTEA